MAVLDACLPRRGFLGLFAAAGLAACSARDAAPSDLDGSGLLGAFERNRISYGAHDEAFGDLHVPAEASMTDPVAVVVLIHGGFWRDGFRLDLMDGLAESLVGAGYAAWNIEYRRVGGGGGYPETFHDVAAAVDHLAALDDGRLDLGRVAAVGHSAGGHLAAWVASRHRLPADAPGADPVVRPVVAFAQAGVLDLVGCAQDRVGGSACPDLLGGAPDEVADRYAVASPLALVPVGVPVIAVHGDDDGNVPLRQSQTYVETATASGDPAELVVVEGADHFDVIDPRHQAWKTVLARLSEHLST